MDADLADLIESTIELKRLLVRFAEQPRFDRFIGSALAEVAAQTDGLLDERIAFQVMDDFIFAHQMPDGATIIDHVIRQHRDLTVDQRAMLLSWRDPVVGIFEVQRKDRDSILLHNLIDDLKYRVYSNMGPAIFRPFKRGFFVQARLVPVGNVWVVSGVLDGLPRSGAKDIAQVAVKAATQFPSWTFRNEDLLNASWAMMAEKRAEFIAAFGADEVILAPGDVAVRMAQLGYVDDNAIRLTDEALHCEAIGVVFDGEDGLGLYPDYQKLHELFANPSLASDRQCADLLLMYLRSDSFKPSPLRRLAEAYPEHVDAVYQKVLKQRHFNWSKHGEALLRKHKPWYYEQDQLPPFAVMGKRLEQLLQAK